MSKYTHFSVLSRTDQWTVLFMYNSSATHTYKLGLKIFQQETLIGDKNYHTNNLVSKRYIRHIGVIFNCGSKIKCNIIL